jgi:hypothetical protein
MAKEKTDHDLLIEIHQDMSWMKKIFWITILPLYLGVAFALGMRIP